MFFRIFLIYIALLNCDNPIEIGDKLPLELVEAINKEVIIQNGKYFTEYAVPKYFEKKKSNWISKSISVNGKLVKQQLFDDLGRITNSTVYKDGSIIYFNINLYNDKDQIEKAISNHHIRTYDYQNDSTTRVKFTPFENNYLDVSELIFTYNNESYKTEIFGSGLIDTFSINHILNKEGYITENTTISKDGDTISYNKYRYDLNNRICHSLDLGSYESLKSNKTSIFPNSESKYTYAKSGLVKTKEIKYLGYNYCETHHSYMEFFIKVKKRKKTYIVEITRVVDGAIKEKDEILFNSRYHILKKVTTKPNKEKNREVIYEYIYRN